MKTKRSLSITLAVCLAAAPALMPIIPVLALGAGVLLLTGCAGMQDTRNVHRDSFPYYSQAPKVMQYTWCQHPQLSMVEPHPWPGFDPIWGGPANWRVENVGTR